MQQRQRVGGQIVQAWVAQAEGRLCLSRRLLLAKNVGHIVGAERAGRGSLLDGIGHWFRSVLADQFQANPAGSANDQQEHRGGRPARRVGCVPDRGNSGVRRGRARHGEHKMVKLRTMPRVGFTAVDKKTRALEFLPSFRAREPNRKETRLPV